MENIQNHVLDYRLPHWAILIKMDMAVSIYSFKLPCSLLDFMKRMSQYVSENKFLISIQYNVVIPRFGPLFIIYL